MWTAILVVTNAIFIVKWRIEKMKFKSLIYFMVDKGYTAPTAQEMERCIRIVAEKTTEELIGK